MRRSLLLVMVVAAGCGLVTPAAAVPRCLYISGTADALRKPKAVEDSLVALQDAITKWKTDNGITGVVNANGAEAGTASLLAQHGRTGPVPAARHGHRYHVHRLLEGRGVAGGLHLRRQSLLVADFGLA